MPVVFIVYAVVICVPAAIITWFSYKEGFMGIGALFAQIIGFPGTALIIIIKLILSAAQNKKTMHNNVKADKYTQINHADYSSFDESKVLKLVNAIFSSTHGIPEKLSVGSQYITATNGGLDHSYSIIDYGLPELQGYVWYVTNNGEGDTIVNEGSSSMFIFVNRFVGIIAREYGVEYKVHRNDRKTSSYIESTNDILTTYFVLSYLLTRGQ